MQSERTQQLLREAEDLGVDVELLLEYVVRFGHDGGDVTALMNDLERRSNPSLRARGRVAASALAAMERDELPDGDTGSQGVIN